MAKYLFVYHGGKMHDTKEEVEADMAAWGQWMGSLGNDIIDGGNPVGSSVTVESDGTVVENGGANPTTGYGIFEASSQEDAIAKAKGCPVLAIGGSVEVAPAIEL